MNSNTKKGIPHPQDSANFISKVFYWWTRNIYKKSYDGNLNLDDLYDPLIKDKANFLGDILENKWNENFKKSKLEDKKSSLWKTIILTFWYEYLILVFRVIVELIFLLVTPLLLGLLLQYFKTQPSLTYKEALLCAGGLVVVDFLKHIAQNHTIYESLHLGIRIRIAVCSLVYRKALHLSMSALNETSPGKIINFMAKDVNKFDFFIKNSIHMWDMPLTVLVVMCILYFRSGYFGLIGMATLIILIPIPVIMGYLSVKYKLQSSIKADERIRLLNEIISGIKVIKMYAWEKSFYSFVESVRKAELKVIKKSSCFRDTFLTFSVLNSRLAMYCTMIVMVYYGENLSPQNVFVILPYLYAASDKMLTSIKGFFDLIDTLDSVKRIESFLSLAEIQTNVCLKDLSQENKNINTSHGCFQYDLPSSSSESTSVISFKELTIRWSSHLPNLLEKVNLAIEEGKLYLIIGIVGSGKSSLLASILGETMIIDGIIKCSRSLSYAAQEAWIFGNTIRQNITFGQNFDQRRYNKVINVCCLLKDFGQLPKGDLTIVGEKGVFLSGGQKARINLARAVYKETDVYLLDDPLSAVDAHVGKYIFEECLQNYLRNKTRLVVTHQIQYIKEVDCIILVDGNGTQQYSNYKQFLNHHPEYDRLVMEKISTDDAIPLENINDKQQYDESVYENLAVNDVNKLDDILENTSKTEDGNSLLKYFQQGTNISLFIVMCTVFITMQICISSNDFFLLSFITAESTQSTQKSDHREEDHSYATTNYIYTYTALIVSILVFSLTRTLMFHFITNRNSRNLYNYAFLGLINTKLKFFHKNPSGRILNRFSEDTMIIDELLPKTILESSQIVFLCMGAIVISCIVEPIFLLPITVIIAVYMWINIRYSKMNNTLSRFERIARAPVFTYLNETLNGIETIRASKAQQILKDEYDNFQNWHTSVWFNLLQCRFAYGLVIKLLLTIFILFITFSFVIFREHFSSGQVGLAITQIFCTTTFISYGAIMCAETANYLTSVDRLLEYSKLPGENQNCGKKVKENQIEDNLSSFNYPELKVNNLPGIFGPLMWPSEGCIVFEKVYLRYAPEEEPVLKDLNFTIKSKEKIGIVGRTGAGKSSLISALFRLADIEGSIKIDGRDIRSISLDILRSHISIIPQDPVLFSGTLRKNLDPFNKFSDHEVWDALEKVELKDLIATSEKGLDFEVADKGTNYSLGQRQLVCLARAILKRNCILVLDEATANVDPQTDSLVQKTIRTKFLSFTVLTVAHRLNTIIDSDRVMVMDNGCLVEFDHPYNLLRNKNSKFFALAEETGSVMSQKLFEDAKHCFNEAHNAQN